MPYQPCVLVVDKDVLLSLKGPDDIVNIEKVAVIGAGVMGSGIAAHVANAGLPVTLLDIVPKGAQNRNIITETAVQKMLKPVRMGSPTPLMHRKNARLITTGNIEDHLITYHKSQSYHHEYFAGKERLYSYSEEAFQVLKALKDQIQTHKAFIQEYLSEPDDSFKIIDVEEFKSFFRNPSKFLLKKRLGINLDEEVSVLIDKEPFDLKGLDRYIVEKDLLEGCLKEKDANEIFAKIKAKGIIPHDPTGRCILEKSSTEISFFAKSLKKYISHQQEKTIDLELKLMDCTITGILENIFGNTCICYRYAKIKATDMLNAWINHLILHLVDVDNPRTVLMGIDRGQETRVMVYLFAPVSSPEEILESLVETFKTGIRRPIPFFPESSLEFAKLMKKNDENDVINRIKHRFYGDEYRFGEGQDPYYDLCFGGLDPFDEEFKRLSKSIFEPLLKHLNNRV